MHGEAATPFVRQRGSPAPFMVQQNKGPEGCSPTLADRRLIQFTMAASRKVKTCCLRDESLSVVSPRSSRPC